uniref:Probable Pol polyprotein n=1 Tax=Erwinia amylovora ATCC BAA-2158 TaxID=889211 RepID=E5B6V9_ERWAM|nr:probable Pol polyprotein [Erwinia amylovora ATCC BAA-2158]
MKEKTLTCRNAEPLAVPASLNQSWSIDFMHDALTCGRRFRTFNVVDDFNREALAIEIDFKLPAQRVIRVLDRIAYSRGYPLKLRMDNGHEFISLMLAEWAETREVVLEFIKPGKPTQNAFIERFNRT